MTTKRVLRNWVCFSTGEPYTPNADAHGMVYKITDHDNGKIYIGKKQLFKTIPYGKKEMALVEKIDKRKKYVKRVETDWRKYCSSNKTLSAKIKSESCEFSFQVLHECYDETALKFKELEEIIKHCSFSSENGYNDNIQIKQIGKIKNLELRYMKL